MKMICDSEGRFHSQITDIVIVLFKKQKQNTNWKQIEIAKNVRRKNIHYI